MTHMLVEISTKWSCVAISHPCIITIEWSSILMGDTYVAIDDSYIATGHSCVATKGSSMATNWSYLATNDPYFEKKN